jgi:hypothetical protein
MKLRAVRGWRFGISDNFVITDENGTERYTAKGNAVGLQVFDMNGKVVGALDSGMKIASASQVKKYSLVVGGEKVGMFNRKEKAISYVYEFADLPWTFDRDTDEVKQDDVVIAKLEDTASFFLHLLSFAPRKYEVDIPNAEHEIPALLITLGWHYYEAQ